MTKQLVKKQNTMEGYQRIMNTIIFTINMVLFLCFFLFMSLPFMSKYGLSFERINYKSQNSYRNIIFVFESLITSIIVVCLYPNINNLIVSIVDLILIKFNTYLTFFSGANFGFIFRVLVIVLSNLITILYLIIVKIITRVFFDIVIFNKRFEEQISISKNRNISRLLYCLFMLNLMFKVVDIFYEKQNEYKYLKRFVYNYSKRLKIFARILVFIYVVLIFIVIVFPIWFGQRFYHSENVFLNTQMKSILTFIVDNGLLFAVLPIVTLFEFGCFLDGDTNPDYDNKSNELMSNSSIKRKKIVRMLSTNFTVNEQGEITGYNGQGGIVRTPQKIKTGLFDKAITVTAIGDGAFANRNDIEEVFIPEGVKYIGKSAFRGCHYLYGVYLPDGLDIIDDMAFYECTNLQGIEIPDSVRAIGSEVFSYCQRLRFARLPSNIDAIGDMSFLDCISLEKINIPDKMLYPGHKTFKHCPKLADENGFVAFNGVVFDYYGNEYAVIPDGIIEIGDNAFEGKEINEAFIPYSVRRIGKYAFANCSKLSRVSISGGVEKIEESAFQLCEALSKIVIPNSVKVIGAMAFQGCDCLADENGLVIVNHVLYDYVGEGVEVKIPYGVEAISAHAFDGNTDVTDVTIPNSVTSIGEYAFDMCRGLEKLTIPDSVKFIGEKAFDRWLDLTLEVTEGSYAEEYAKENGIPFAYTTGHKPEKTACVEAKSETPDGEGTISENKTVFISYSSKETSLAEQTKRVLEKNGISCWLSTESIPGGADYVDDILNAISNCRVVVLLLSSYSQESPWVKREIDTAISEGKIIIPLHVDNSEVERSFDFLLKRNQRIEAFERMDSAFDELVGTIKKIIS